MKIKIDRIQSENILTFTIMCFEVQPLEFGKKELKIMETLESYKNNLSLIQRGENIVIQEAIDGIHSAQHNEFNKLKESLEFQITNTLAPKFKHICQEIYNWIYDHQTGQMRQWMQTFDPQRTKYYFDNDNKE